MEELKKDCLTMITECHKRKIRIFWETTDSSYDKVPPDGGTRITYWSVVSDFEKQIGMDILKYYKCHKNFIYVHRCSKHSSVEKKGYKKLKIGKFHIEKSIRKKLIELEPRYIDKMNRLHYIMNNS